LSSWSFKETARAKASLEKGLADAEQALAEIRSAV